VKKKQIKLLSIFKSNGLKDTFLLAKMLAENLKGGEIIFLYGSIGSGKTTFVKGLSRALGIKTNLISASFALIRNYAGKKVKLTHIDAFRIKECETYNLGLEEILADKKNIIAVEWPGALENIFPKDILKIKIKLLSGDKRNFTFIAKGAQHIKLLKKTVEQNEK
jgi:tRNA threonylcarbamoyladenosine biosynthesis protein TsaE